jgi:hypothetical protein
MGLSRPVMGLLALTYKHPEDGVRAPKHVAAIII